MPRLDPLLWRIAVIVALPAAMIAWHAATADIVVDSAGGITYQVRINHLTDEACLHFGDRQVPKGLADLSC